MSKSKEVKISLSETRCPELYQHIIPLHPRSRAGELIVLASRGLQSKSLAQEIVQELTRALPELKTLGGNIASDAIAGQESTDAPAEAIDLGDALFDKFLGEAR